MGEFKYCPECAYRLSGTQIVPVAARPKYWSATLLGLALAGVLAVVLVAGQAIFKSQARSPSSPGTSSPPVTPPTRTTEEPLTMEDLSESFESVQGGTAFVVDAMYPYALDAEAQIRNTLSRAPRAEDLFAQLLAPTSPRAQLARVTTSSFYLMRYEVTRGQWAEFLQAASASMSRLEATPWVRDLWLPRTEHAKKQTARYVGAWIDSVVGSLGEEHRGKLEELLRVPLGVDARLWLLAPPSWIEVDTEGTYTRRMPAGTANFPVSDVCAVDAEVFIVWARSSVNMADLRLPTVAEFRRAFHRGKPPTLDGTPGSWPWGDVLIPGYANTRDYQQRTGQSGPIPVFGPNVRLRSEALRCIAGNVAEWVRPVVLEHNGDVIEATAADSLKRLTLQVAGGSYLDHPEACRRLVWPAYERMRRLPHVGFRLALPSSNLGSGR